MRRHRRHPRSSGLLGPPGPSGAAQGGRPSCCARPGALLAANTSACSSTASRDTGSPFSHTLPARSSATYFHGDLKPTHSSSSESALVSGAGCVSAAPSGRAALRSCPWGALVPARKTGRRGGPIGRFSGPDEPLEGRTGAWARGLESRLPSPSQRTTRLGGWPLGPFPEGSSVWGPRGHEVTAPPRPPPPPAHQDAAQSWEGGGVCGLDSGGAGGPEAASAAPAEAAGSAAWGRY